MALKRRFFRHQVRLQTGENLQTCPFDYSAPVRIVGRGQCLYRSASFSHVPAAKRAGALKVQLGIWSPFETFGHYVVWQQGHAQVWLWDEEYITRDHPLQDREQVYPESVWHAGQGDGLLLAEATDGFDLQHWNAGILQQSHWFAEPPSTEEVQLFCRANRLGETSLQEQPLNWRSEPWRSPATWEDVGLELEPGLLAAAVFIVLVTGIWQEARIWKSEFAAARMQGNIETLQAGVGEAVGVRQQFNEMAQRNTTLGTALEQPSQADIMSRLHRYVPNEDVKFEFWSYRQGEIRLSVKDSDADQEAYVRGIEQDPMFQDVRVELSGGQGSVIIRARVPHGRVETGEEG